MQEDFHYYATYAAAYLAGYSHEESCAVCYSAQFVDLCTRTFLSRVKGPLNAATTQLSMEMMDADTNTVGLQDITRIWASFHFLPRDLYATKKHVTKRYLRKYRLICGPNGELLKDTVELAKDSSLQAAGIAMHVLADTWAHRNFAGTPSLVINNTDSYFYEIFTDGTEKKINFRHTTAPDDVEKGQYTASIYQGNENSIMNLGHGRAGHLPDYSFIRYKYLPAWGGYEEIIKDNPTDYYKAFRQMIHAMQYIRGDISEFKTDYYDGTKADDHSEKIHAIIEKRQVSASEDWKAFGESLSGKKIPDFSIETYIGEYADTAEDEKNDTFLGRFFISALAQKSMVTNRIFSSGNKLAGYSIEYKKGQLSGINDYKMMAKALENERKGESADE